MEKVIKFFCKKIDQSRRFTFVDIGAMGGIPKKWNILHQEMLTVGFEPDDREFIKLCRANKENHRYFNCILSDTTKELYFYLTQKHGRSSLYKPNKEFLSAFEDIDRFKIIKEQKIELNKVETLNSVFKNFDEKYDIDFMKIDTQGSEFSILKGADEILDQVFGLQIEAEFVEMYKNQPLFFDIHQFMTKKGFQIIDIRRQYWKRRDYYDYVGKGQ
jgi:FkbM family methyltransferase